MTTYATATDYAEFKGVADDYDTAERARINAGLLNAQSDVDGQIRFMRYDLTDEAITTALTRATCARFDYMEESGDDGSGVFGIYDSTAIASVRLARRTGTGAEKPTDPVVEALGNRAAQILYAAGIISAVVYHS